MFLDQMCDDFSIGFGRERVAFLDQFFLETEIVFDDAIVHHDDLAGAGAVRMSIFFSGTAVRGPTGMADAITAFKRLDADDFFQVAQLALGAAHLQLVAIAGNGDSGRVIPAVFETPQTINNDGNHFLLADVANNATHAGAPGLSLRGSSEILRSQGW